MFDGVIFRQKLVKSFIIHNLKNHLPYFRNHTYKRKEVEEKAAVVSENVEGLTTQVDEHLELMRGFPSSVYHIGHV